MVAAKNTNGIDPERAANMGKTAEITAFIDPVRETSEALSLGSDHVWEDFAEIHPNHRALREREKGDEADQQPYEHLRVLAGGEHPGNAGQTQARACRSGKQQFLAAEAVNHRHRDTGEYEIREADQNRLQVA